MIGSIAGRFDAERPPEHALHDDSFWYAEPVEQRYVNLHAAALEGDLGMRLRLLMRLRLHPVLYTTLQCTVQCE